MYIMSIVRIGMLGGLMYEKMGRAKRREERAREERLVAW